jgi:hypothetical protein
MSIHIGHDDRNVSAEQVWLRRCRQPHEPSTGSSAAVGPAQGELAPGDAALRRACLAERFAKGASSFGDIPDSTPPPLHLAGGHLLEIAVAPIPTLHCHSST